MQKKCTKCSSVLPHSSFHKDKQKKDGLSTWCKECKNETSNNHFLKNKERIIEAHKKRYKENKEEINRKRRKYKEVSGRGEYNKHNPTHFDFGASNRKGRGVSSFNRLVRQYKNNAKRRGIFFDLSEDAIARLTSQRCAYCDREPTQIMKSGDSFGEYVYNGIDRVDNKYGYSEDNCTSACKWCNKAKGSMTTKEWDDFRYRISEKWFKEKQTKRGEQSFGCHG